MKRILALFVLLLVLGGCTTMDSTTSFNTPVSSSAIEEMENIEYTPVMLPQIEGLVLPDEKRVRQFATAESESHYLKNDYIWPTNYNGIVAQEKGLYVDGARWTEEYYIIQALYRKVFEVYLNDLLDLESYEYLFHEYPEVPLVIAPNDIKNYYWYCSTLNMECFYLRNNLCVERLNEADLAVFLSYHERGEYDVTQELTEIVVRTFPEVIRVVTEDNSVANSFEVDLNNLNIFYEPASGRKGADNNAIVFEIAYYEDYNLYSSEEYGARGMYWYDNIQLVLQEELQKKMPDYPVEVFDESYH